jgi:type II secretory pathway pseudopilin PulG
MMKKLIKYQVAFTLLEVSIALVVIGLLIGGGMSLMSASSDVSKYKVTQVQLDEVKEGLVSYYTQFFRLPCPDTDGDGVENFASGNCTNTRGFLPHVTLGIGGNADAWGERFKYAISPKFVLPVVTPPTACYSATMREATGKIIINDLVVPLSSANPVMDFAAFAVLSTGKNGRQTNAGMTAAFSNDGGCAALNERERENCNNDSILRTGTPMSDGNTVVFDDMLAWIGDMQLIALLRQSGACESPSAQGHDPTTRTSTIFTADPGKTTNNYNANDNIATSAAADKVIINQNQNKNLDLQDGDNTLDIGQNSNATVTSGAGNDVVRIQNNLNQPVNLGAGNDYLEVWGHGNAPINMGSGDDAVRIEGNVNHPIELGSGVNSIYIGGSVNANVTATGGSAVVYYDSSSISSWQKNRLSGLTVKCNVSGSWVDC